MLTDLKTVRKIVKHLDNVNISGVMHWHPFGQRDSIRIDFDMDSDRAHNVIKTEALNTIEKDPNYLLSITEQDNGGANYKLTTAHHKLIKQGSEPSFYLATLRMFEAYCGDRFDDE